MVNYYKVVITVLAVGVASFISHSVTLAAQGNAAVSKKSGVEFARLIRDDGTQFGIIQILKTPDTFFVVNAWRQDQAPTEAILAARSKDVTSNLAGDSSFFDDAQLTLIGQTDQNRFWQADFPNGAFVVFAENISTGQITIIGSGTR